MPTGATKVAGVIGHPVTHSLSPTLCNTAFVHLGLDWVYVAWDVAPGNGGSAVASMRTLGIAAMSVTMPHKKAAFEACDERSEVATALGAVNCIANQDGRLIGHNTDGAGLVAALRAQLGLNLQAMPTTIVGAGGAGRAAALALCGAGAEVAIVNRSSDGAVAAAAMVSQWAGAGDNAVGTCTVAESTTQAITEARLVVNATPVGMSVADPLPFDVELLTDSHIVVDLIYHPIETRLLVAAKRRGAATANGVGMLLYQAAEQLKIWTGRSAPIDVMSAAVGLSLD